MANPYVTGPVHLYIGRRASAVGTDYGRYLTESIAIPTTSASIFYLGTCESAPAIEHQARHAALHSDFYGGENGVPFDTAWMGMEARIELALTRWNEYVYAKLAAYPFPHSGDRGSWTATDVGTLNIHDGKAFALWCHFPYYSKFGVDGSGNPGGHWMPKGYRYLAVRPDRELMDPGSGPFKRTIYLSAVPVYNVATGASVLYDEDMTFIPSVPPSGVQGTIS